MTGTIRCKCGTCVPYDERCECETTTETLPPVRTKPFHRGAWIELRERVARDATFDMGRYFHECGTPACLAGHACAIRGYRPDEDDDSDVTRDGLAFDDVEDVAGRALGISPPSGFTDTPLFHASLWPMRYQQIAAYSTEGTAALQILDDIIDGKIDPDTLEPPCAPT